VAGAGPRLHRTLAPATAKTERERLRRAVEVTASRDNHAAFAALKAAAFGAAEARHTAAAFAVATWSRAPVAVIVAAAIHLAMLASFGASSLAGAGVSAVDAGAAATVVRGLGGYLQLLFGFASYGPAAVAAGYAVAAAAGAMMVALRRKEGAAAASVAREMAAREQEYLADLHRGTFSCRWRPDVYAAPGLRNQVSTDKALTNAAVAAAAAAAAADRRVPPSAAPALVLDAVDGRTSVALAAAYSSAADGCTPVSASPFVSVSARAPTNTGLSGLSAVDGMHEQRSFDDVYGEDEVVVSAPYMEGSADMLGLRQGGVGSGGLGLRYEQSIAGGGGGGTGMGWARSVDRLHGSGMEEPAGAEAALAGAGSSTGGRGDEDADGCMVEDLVGDGFPPCAVFVPNQHTHVVHSLRHPESGAGVRPGPPEPVCSAFAADVRDVLERRRPAATPFNLVYLAGFRGGVSHTMLCRRDNDTP